MQILQNSERLDVANKITSQVEDATKVDLEAESFDKILLDAPCSALGQRPMLIQDARVKELKSFAKLQKKLFDKAVKLLKPGGLLVYSTCTITFDENEGLVKWALEKYSQTLEICQTAPILGENGFSLGEHSEKVQRFGPGVEAISTIGFFIAKFRKIYWFFLDCSQDIGKIKTLDHFKIPTFMSLGSESNLKLEWLLLKQYH